jgi:hypothetical protein
MALEYAGSNIAWQTLHKRVKQLRVNLAPTNLEIVEAIENAWCVFRRNPDPLALPVEESAAAATP